MTVNDEGVEAEALEARLVHVHLVLEGGRLGLAKAINVEDNTQVIELLDARKAQSLPDGTLGTLAITNQAIGSAGNYCSSGTENIW